MDENNKQLKCECCEKEYKTKDGIQRHYVAAHYMHYDRRMATIMPLSGDDLAEEMRKLRKKQDSEKN